MAIFQVQLLRVMLFLSATLEGQDDWNCGTKIYQMVATRAFIRIFQPYEYDSINRCCKVHDDCWDYTGNGLLLCDVEFINCANKNMNFFTRPFMEKIVDLMTSRDNSYYEYKCPFLHAKPEMQVKGGCQITPVSTESPDFNNSKCTVRCLKGVLNINDSPSFDMECVHEKWSVFEESLGRWVFFNAHTLKFLKCVFDGHSEEKELLSRNASKSSQGFLNDRTRVNSVDDWRIRRRNEEVWRFTDGDRRRGEYRKEGRGSAEDAQIDCCSHAFNDSGYHMNVWNGERSVCAKRRRAEAVKGKSNGWSKGSIVVAIGISAGILALVVAIIVFYRRWHEDGERIVSHFSFWFVFSNHFVLFTLVRIGLI